MLLASEVTEMSEKPSKASLALSLVAASVISFIAYLLICSALRPRGGLPILLSEYERYFALALSLLIFLIVFYRMLRHSWGWEQVGKLMDFDDTNL
jgi:hypothetical protein